MERPNPREAGQSPAAHHPGRRARSGRVRQVSRRIAEGFERVHQAVGAMPVAARGRVAAGNTFDVDVSLFHWLLSVG